MIWSTVKGAFMLQSSEIFVASGLLFPPSPSYILLVRITRDVRRLRDTEDQTMSIHFIIWAVRPHKKKDCIRIFQKHYVFEILMRSLFMCGQTR